MCTNIDKEFQDWFKEPKQIANEVGADLGVPRYSDQLTNNIVQMHQQAPHHNTSNSMLAYLSWIISTKK